MKENKLLPGDLIFYDQYEARVEGRLFSARGYSSTSRKYCGGTIFCDAASKRIFVVHQVGLTGQKTVQAKLHFERYAAGVGVFIQNYCTDNGVYTSNQSALELQDKGQGIKHSGVGAHHHNGVAENAIKNSV